MEIATKSKVRPGYKQTEAGVIPEAWTVCRLGDCLMSPPACGINAPAVPFTTSLPVYIRITDITEDGCFSPEKLVSVKGADTEQYFLNEGDLVFARTGASVGKSYLYNPDDGRLVFAGFLIRVKPNQAKLNPPFLATYVMTGRYWSWVNVMSMRSGQPGINGNEYAQLPIPLPPIEEQRHISAVLSDVEKLIAFLDNLIAKKRDLKQGAMQELLTGKRRLPGFATTNAYKQTEVGVIPGDWTVRSLGNLCEISAGRDLVKEDFSLVSDENHQFPIYSNALTKMGLYGYSTSYQYEPAKITVTARGDVGHAAFRSGRFCAIGRLLVMSSTHPCDLRFVTEYINNFVEFALESTGVPQLTAPQISNYAVALPPTKDEQSAIATVLSDMDAEVGALEQQLNKYRDIKQGMMQKLLTGKTRLI